MENVNFFISDPDSPSGYLMLNDPRKGLILTADTLQQSSMSYKRVTASNAYLPGTFTVRAVPDNITETIAIRITDGYAVRRNRTARHLIYLFSRVSYELVLALNEFREHMTGQTADYVRVDSRDFLHNQMTQLTFTVPVLPLRTTEEVS